MNKFNLNNIYPLIPNQNQYLCDKKYISINSIDRDSLKYPNASLFEIELPQDYLNLQAIRLFSWSFPANYSVFTPVNKNMQLVFKFTNIYNPIINNVNDPLQLAIYSGLQANLDKSYIITIEEGFYNPTQMSKELKNKMNSIVNDELIKYFENNSNFTNIIPLLNENEYNEFEVVYNSVGQKLWFGNQSSGFEIVNNSPVYLSENLSSNVFGQRIIPSFSNWGLPSYLGFSRCPEKSIEAQNSNEYRFFYLEINNGLWIKPSNLPGAKVHFLTAPLKINFMGPAYLYMELECNSSLNCIDETEPFQLDKFTTTTNQTNGIVNSCFAKVAIPTTPISQWFDNGDISPYKWFDPPLERLRKLKIKMRYHDGLLVDFSGFDYSIMLELTILSPQIPRKKTISNSICN